MSTIIYNIDDYLSTKNSVEDRAARGARQARDTPDKPSIALAVESGSWDLIFSGFAARTLRWWKKRSRRNVDQSMQSMIDDSSSL